MGPGTVLVGPGTEVVLESVLAGPGTVLVDPADPGNSAASFSDPVPPSDLEVSAVVNDYWTSSCFW